MPEIEFTKDHKVLLSGAMDDLSYKFLTPIVSPLHVKIPVLQKITLVRFVGGVPLLVNRNDEVLSVLLDYNKGRLIILPQYQSNEDIISTFLHRVMPKLYNLERQSNLIERFISPEEKKRQNESEEIQQEIAELNKAIETTNEQLNSARRKKTQTIKQDETSTLILKYYDLAVQQDDVALFYLYKVIEALEKKCGGEKVAKNKLGCNTEWKLIGKLANVSYADIRHAPKPGEKIKEWTKEEIDKCFEAAEKIIYAYLATLF